MGIIKALASRWRVGQAWETLNPSGRGARDAKPTGFKQEASKTRTYNPDNLREKVLSETA
jgi:hypothetical protein